MAETLHLLGDVTDVSNAAAIVGLDTLVEEGRLIDERADYLKEKFKELHNRVLVVYKRDFFLLKRARQLRKELDAQKERMAARGKVAQDDDSEIQRLNKLLMDTEEELSDAQERESILQVEVLELDRKKHTVLLEREDAIAAEEAQLRPRMDAIRQEITCTSNELEEMVEQCKTLSAKRDVLLAQEVEAKEALVRFKTTMADTSRQLANIERLPEHSLRQAQVILKSHEAATLESKALDEKLAAQADMIAKLELKKSNRNLDYEQVLENLQKLKCKIDSKHATISTLNAALDMEQEARMGYLQRIAQIGDLISATTAERAKCCDDVKQARRDLEQAREEYAELDIALCNVVREQKEVKDNIASVMKTIERVQTTRKRNAQRLDDARRDAEKRNQFYIREQNCEREFAAKAQAVGADIEVIEKELKNRTLQEEAKRREIKALVVRLQELSSERAKGKSRIIMGKHELRMKEMYVSDARKRLSDLELRLDSITDTFQSIKHERTHKAAQIQAITQKMTEMTEKKAILENELVVLCRESAVKEGELLKKRRHIHKLRQMCRALRLEKNNQRRCLERRNIEERNAKAQARRVANRIASMEAEMGGVKQTYQSIIEERDGAGIQLLDRNDELCVLYERFKTQEKVIRDGIAMDNARVGEIRALRIKLTDVRRQADIVRASVPQVKELEDQLANILDDIDDEQWKVEVLENDLTNPRNAHRWRVLNRQNAGRGGASGASAVQQPSSEVAARATSRGPMQGQAVVAFDGCSDDVVNLQLRHQQLEERVRVVKERIREKDLILEEVAELSARLAEQVKNGRDFTLALAKQVNSHHHSIRDKTRQMMATVSELSVFQASAIQLQQDVQRLEGVVEEAERLMAQGEAPFAEAEERYIREVECKARYRNALQRRKEEELESDRLKGPVVYVEQRPNAYIPDDGLSVPRPFGALMPFKPTPTIQTARYYRGKTEHQRAIVGKKRGACTEGNDGEWRSKNNDGGAGKTILLSVTQ